MNNHLTITCAALGFIATLRQWLTPAEFAEMQHKQRTQPQAGICYSHDYCDANMAMHGALTELLGREPWMSSDVEDGDCSAQDHERDMLLFDTAWNLAKGANFDAKPLIVGAGAGRPVLHLTEHGAYSFTDENEGIEIHNPVLSSCGRFNVSPADYGFTEYNTGGNCMAWRRDFQLEDGTPVYLLVTDTDGGLPDKNTHTVTLGVYYELTEGWLNWAQGYDPEPLGDMAAEGWEHGAPTPTTPALAPASGALSLLTDLYTQWLQRVGLAQLSADELLLEDITPEQREWLSAFIVLWQDAERA